MKNRLSMLAIACTLSASAFSLQAAEYVLTDAAKGQDLGNWSINNNDLSIDKPFSISQRVLHGGKQEGVRVIDIDNGVMRVTLVPTRGMDIYQVKSSDIRLGWDSPVTEIVNPAYIDLESRGGLGWLDGFNEMLVRCGYEWTGHPGEDNGHLLSLHGRAGNTPASEVIVSIDEKAPYAIHIKGKLLEKTFKFNDFQTWTEFNIIPGEKKFAIHDQLTNLSDYKNEYQIIYHSNFGRPLLENGARFVAPVKEVSPFNDYAAERMSDWSDYQGPTRDYNETVFNIVPYADKTGHSMAVLHNPKGDRGIAVGFNVKQLPVLGMWKNTDTEKQGYVTGIEPGTSYSYNRSLQRSLGLVPTIQPGETKTFDVSYTILDSKATVDDAVKQVNSIKNGRATKVLKKPLAIE